MVKAKYLDLIIMESTVLPFRNIHEYTWTSLMRRQIVHVLRDKSNQIQFMSNNLQKLTVILTIIWWLQKLDRERETVSK
jgi:hypothetical protein